MSPSERVLRRDARTIPYLDTETGPGRPLVLLHSMGSDRRSFLPAIARLRDHRRCIAPDLGGHGLRQGVDAWDFDPTVDDVIALLDGLGTEVDLLGVSLGGAVAQAVAARRPDAIRRLVLTCTFVALPHGRERLASHTTMARDTLTQQEWAAERARAVLVDPAPADSIRLLEEIYSTVDRAEFLRIAQSVYGIDVSDLTVRIGHETLVITGERDDRLPPAVAEALLARLAHATHLVLADAGHLPHLDRPAAFASAVLDFIDAGDRAPSASSTDEHPASLDRDGGPSGRTRRGERNIG